MIVLYHVPSEGQSTHLGGCLNETFFPSSLVQKIERMNKNTLESHIKLFIWKFRLGKAVFASSIISNTKQINK